MKLTTKFVIDTVTKATTQLQALFGTDLIFDTENSHLYTTGSGDIMVCIEASHFKIETAINFKCHLYQDGTLGSWNFTFYNN